MNEDIKGLFYQHMFETKVSPSTVFHQVITERQWSYVVTLAKSYPDNAKKQKWVIIEKKNTKLHALHLACSKKPTEEVVSVLISCYPKASQLSDSFFNRLPLHFACIYAANGDVVRTLLDDNPDAINKVAQNGRLPLHYAAAYGASREVIGLLVERYGLAARVADKRGLLPVHLACLQNASVEVVEILLQSFPGAVYIKTEKGSTPLDCIKVVPENDSNRKAVECLLEKTQSSSNLFQTALETPVRGGKSNQFRLYTNIVKAAENAFLC